MDWAYHFMVGFLCCPIFAILAGRSKLNPIFLVGYLAFLKELYDWSFEVGYSYSNSVGDFFFTILGGLVWISLVFLKKEIKNAKN